VVVQRIRSSLEGNATVSEPDMGHFPIEFLPHSVLIQHGKIPRSDEMLNVYLHELRVSVVRVMVSHRWLSPSIDQSLAHPDTVGNPIHQLLSSCLERLGKEGWIQQYDSCSIVHWLDFSKYPNIMYWIHI
jgi:hypothetical protein